MKNDITIILIIVTVTFIIITISCYFYCIMIIMTVAMFNVVVHLFYFLIIDGFEWQVARISSVRVEQDPWNVQWYEFEKLVRNLLAWLHNCISLVCNN